MKNLLFIGLFMSSSISLLSQQEQNLRNINLVWEKFCNAFADLDYKLIEEIHSKDLVRIAGGSRIMDYLQYVESYKKRFEKLRAKNESYKISLRFFERISNENVASERGIYKLIVNNSKKESKSHYGKFHVIMKKEKGVWKISMDYDNNEQGTINEEDFLNAYDLLDIEPFIKD